MTQVKLYGYATSPFVRKTGCFLYYKNIAFTHIPVDPTNPDATIGFTGQTQVPVLEIDGDWRLESSAHAHWLDELFPEKPLCPPEHHAKIEEIDRWISDSFLLSIFRYPIDGEDNLQFKHSGWRLAALLSAHTPLSEAARHHWPDALRRAPFIQAMAEQMDLTESIPDMQMRLTRELVAHLGDGPFLASLEEPTMLDLAVFPQLVWGYMFGLAETLNATAHPAIKAWLQHVAEHLPDNPTLVADEMMVNSLQSGLQ